MAVRNGATIHVTCGIDIVRALHLPGRVRQIKLAFAQVEASHDAVDIADRKQAVEPLRAVVMHDQRLALVQAREELVDPL